MEQGLLLVRFHEIFIPKGNTLPMFLLSILSFFLSIRNSEHSWLPRAKRTFSSLFPLAATQCFETKFGSLGCKEKQLIALKWRESLLLPLLWPSWNPDVMADVEAARIVRGNASESFWPCCHQVSPRLPVYVWKKYGTVFFEFCDSGFSGSCHSRDHEWIYLGTADEELMQRLREDSALPSGHISMCLCCSLRPSLCSFLTETIFKPLAHIVRSRLNKGHNITIMSTLSGMHEPQHLSTTLKANEWGGHHQATSTFLFRQLKTHV